jgi:hypothetical protein
VGNGVTRPSIVGPCRLEEMQNVLGTHCCPQREEVMIEISQRAAATKGDEAGVTNVG